MLFFVCQPHVSLGEGQGKENSGQQIRAGGAGSKQPSLQLPSLTSPPFLWLLVAFTVYQDCIVIFEVAVAVE